MPRPAHPAEPAAAELAAVDEAALDRLLGLVVEAVAAVRGLPN
jgi:hypothetical protein